METFNLASSFFNRQSSVVATFTQPQPVVIASPPSADATVTSVDPLANKVPTVTTDEQVLKAVQRHVDDPKLHTHRRHHDHHHHSEPSHSAQRILNGINKLFGQLVSNGATDDEKAAFFDKVQKGLKEGFAAIQQQLGQQVANLGTDTTETASTQSAVAKGVNQLQANSVATLPLNQSVDTPAVSNNTNFMAANVQRNDNSELQITTQEGDVVTINFKRETNRNVALYQTIADDGTQTGALKTRSNNMSLSISVEGNLNDEELNALRDLMQKIEQVAEKFFKGKVGDLQNKLGDFQFNNEQIAGFTLNMQSEVSKTLIAAQQTVPADQSASPATSDNTDKVASELQTIANTDSAVNLLTDPQAAVNQVFNNSVAEKTQQFTALVITQTALRQFSLNGGDPSKEMDKVNQPSVIDSSV